MIDWWPLNGKSQLTSIPLGICHRNKSNTEPVEREGSQDREIYMKPVHERTIYPMHKIAGVARQVNFILSTTTGHAAIALPLHGSLAAKMMNRKGIKSIYGFTKSLLITQRKTQKNFFSSMVVSC